MSARLGAAAALLLAQPAAAQDTATPDPAWVGVWQGTIGDLPVVACLDRRWDEGGRGSYYYRKHLVPIGLWREPDAKRWSEQPPGGGSNAGWTILSASPSELRATWSNGKRTLPIRLAALDWRDAEMPASPCESPAFIAPRITGGEALVEAGDFEGAAYWKHEFRPPSHLDVAAGAFTLIEGEPGDGAINVALKKYVAIGSIGDDWVECLSGALASLGTDGYMERDVAPVLLTEDFVSARIAWSDFCGGAHPNHWIGHRLFDRQSGAEIALADWFTEAALATNEYESRLPTADFRAVIMRHWPTEQDAECREIAEESDYWNLGLVREGVIFTPDLPHAATPCEEPMTVPWTELEAWLSEAGRAGLARLR